MSAHSRRKAEHLDLAATDAVAFKGKTTLFDEVHLTHDALPELHVDHIDLATPLVGRTLAAPLLIAGMTGGVDRAVDINRDLAAVAQELGLGFGLGSMRPMLEDGVTDGYLVRDVAPDAVILGNIGVVQARQASIEQLRDLIGRSGVDALAIHLNPGQEVVQPGGDTDFRGGIEAIGRLGSELGTPIVVKETGCGLSGSVGERLVAAGVRWVDTGGAGGTSWVGVETLRARATRSLGELYWDWGIPTAASVAQLAPTGLNIIATGGVRHGLDIARAIALGARAGGMARPFLMAWNQGGRDAVRDLATRVVNEIRVAHLLTGSANPAELRNKPTVLGAELRRWVET